MSPVASSSRTSPELPSLSHTAAGTSASTSMPVSPTTDALVEQEGAPDAEQAIDVKELAEEMKGVDESEPVVSRVPSTTPNGLW